jgi:hypothetical protein
MTQEIASIVAEVMRTGLPVKAAAAAETLSRALGISLVSTRDAGEMEYLEGQFPSGPFERAELRVNHVSQGQLLVLHARPSAPVKKSKINLSSYGPPALDVNPQVPPEGVTTHSFTLGRCVLRFQFTARSNVLRLVVFDGFS